MKFSFPGIKLISSGFSLKETIITLGILIIGIIVTVLSVIYTRRNIQRAAMQDFEFVCTELTAKTESRLMQHAQLLRSGEALFDVSDTVTRETWHEFYLRTKIEYFLPGIQGFGYSMIIPKEKLDMHISHLRNNGFPDYNITPSGDRSIYSSIIYLEPFTGRNLLAFGYDMFSEPVRRKAMETARDSNMAALSDKVTLVQETGEDMQAGVLMYIPVYQRGMPYNTVEERRKAIKGWVYSPYRMKDLMSGIQGGILHSRQIAVRLQIYDDTEITEERLLYDSANDDALAGKRPNLELAMPVVFNGKRWTLLFSGRKEELSFFHRGQVIIWITGFIITALLFVLSMMQINANIRSGQIEELNRQLAKLNADKDRFIAILSHDLKSPFTSILGFLELLTADIRKYSIEDIERHVNTVNEAAKSTYALLEDLLMWTRAHSGKIPFNPRMIPFNDICMTLNNTMAPVADSKKITLTCIEDEKLNIYADSEMLKAILRNLISNAIKFTRPGGQVSVTAQKNTGSTTITVSDTGVGIKPEHAARLFDITKIYSTAGTEGERGSGLGLILCSEFIEKHGGKIWIESEFGKGSDFRFTLPDQKA